MSWYQHSLQVSANYPKILTTSPGNSRGQAKKFAKKLKGRSPAQNYRASETMREPLEWDREYLSLLRLAESLFLDLLEFFAGLSLFFANRASPDFLVWDAWALVLLLAGPKRATLAFLAPPALVASLGLVAKLGAPNIEACTTGAAPALAFTDALGLMGVLALAEA